MIKSNKESFKIIEKFICYPELLRNLVELFSFLDKQTDSKKNEKEMNLFRYIDNARNSFSLEFRNLSH